MCRNDWIKGEKNMMEKILLGSSYLAQAIVMATIAFAVISTIYYLRYNNFAMLGNGLKWSFPNICVTNLLLVEWKFIISTRE